MKTAAASNSLAQVTARYEKTVSGPLAQLEQARCDPRHGHGGVLQGQDSSTARFLQVWEMTPAIAAETVAVIAATSMACLGDAGSRSASVVSAAVAVSVAITMNRLRLGLPASPPDMQPGRDTAKELLDEKSPFEAYPHSPERMGRAT
ncbi:hypothetical protein SLS63_007151 [Diaporthe eres]|uniref:Uncharacterized protein n=1 Tax=Diaporthe eres TaxID=83184 RepID=A0ABR1P6C3_DIAER